MIANRKKVKKLLEEVLLGAIVHKNLRGMRKLFTLSVDYSRDVSNNNEFVIMASYQ